MASSVVATTSALAELKSGDCYEFEEGDYLGKQVVVPEGIELLRTNIDRTNALIAVFLVVNECWSKKNERVVSLVEVSWPPNTKESFVIRFFGFTKMLDDETRNRLRLLMTLHMAIHTISYNPSCESKKEFVGNILTGALQFTIFSNISLQSSSSGGMSLLTQETRSFLRGEEILDTRKKRLRQEQCEKDRDNEDGDDEEERTLCKSATIRQRLNKELEDCSIAGKIFNFLLGVNTESIMTDMNVSEGVPVDEKDSSFSIAQSHHHHRSL